MATKAEYLASLAAKNRWVGTPIENANTSGNTGGEWREYKVLIFADLPNGVAGSAFQVFFVYHEGQPDEEALPAGALRQSASIFQRNLRTFLDANLSASVLRISVDSVNEASEFAICTAYIKSGTPATVKTKRYFVYDVDDQGGGEFVEYVGA